MSPGIHGGYRWLLDFPVIPRLGFVVEASWNHQQLRRVREGEIQSTLGVSRLPDRSSLGVSLGPTVGAEVPVAGPVFALVEGGARVRWLAAEGQSAFLGDVAGHFVAADAAATIVVNAPGYPAVAMTVHVPPQVHLLESTSGCQRVLWRFTSATCWSGPGRSASRTSSWKSFPNQFP